MPGKGGQPAPVLAFLPILGLLVLALSACDPAPSRPVNEQISKPAASPAATELPSVEAASPEATVPEASPTEQPEPQVGAGQAQASPAATDAPQAESSQPATPSVEAPLPPMGDGAWGAAAGPDAIKDLVEEIYVGLGGGGCCGPCPMRGSPQIVSVDPTWVSGGALCVSGCPSWEPVDVRLYHTGGASYSSQYKIQQKGEGHVLLRQSPPMAAPNRKPGWVEVEDDLAAVQILLWWPVQLPRGQWRAEVVCGGVTMEAGLESLPYDWETLSVVGQGGANPLEGERGGDCENNVYAPAAWIEIAGEAYPPDRRMPLGIYHAPKGAGQSQQVFAAYVTSSSQGSFSTEVQIDPASAPGVYYIIVVTDPDTEFLRKPALEGGTAPAERIVFLGEIGCFSLRP